MTTPPREALLPPRGRRFLLWTVMLGFSAAASLALSEAALRAYEAWQRRRSVPPVVLLDLLQPNPHGTGSYRLKPNLRLQAEVDRRKVLVRTNRYGMPWREVELEKRRGRQRVAFLGDSFAFGCWADTAEKSLAGVFETRVSPARWEALNFGVGGYGPLDMELLLREEVIRFAPDYVIVVFFNGNDFRDAFLGLDKESVGGGIAHLDADNVRRRVPASLLREETHGPRPLAEDPDRRRALESLAVFRLLAPFLGLENLQMEFAVPRNFIKFSFWQGVPYPPVALAAKDQALATLARMKEFLTRHGSELAVVALPTAEQVYSTQLAGLDFDIGFPQAYVHVFARENGIPYLDLLPPFREDVRARNRRLYVKDDIHLNNQGHALAGRLIADWFRCCVRAGAGPRPQPLPRPAASPSS